MKTLYCIERVLTGIVMTTCCMGLFFVSCFVLFLFKDADIMNYSTYVIVFVLSLFATFGLFKALSETQYNLDLIIADSMSEEPPDPPDESDELYEHLMSSITNDN